ncbi:MAG: DUF2505 domain-containing protein [Propionibacteriaceae bacterium]|jgi:hypothetical protein|nr:DUF2505 domain-containing protein [Propionibacteriaceae bacterium]
MQIISTLTFAGPCDRVADMLINPEFAQFVGAEIGAGNVTVTSLDDGLTAVFTVDTPTVAKRIVGAQMTVTETITWQAATPAGIRVGRMTMSLLGLPVCADGPLRLTATPDGSEIVYDTEFAVRIPLVGNKIEKVTEKHILGIIAACESVGNRWLADPAAA